MRSRWPFALLALATLLAATLPEAFAAGPTPAVSIYNLDPELGASNNGAIWDPNYLPGFNASLPAHIQWSAPRGGPATVDYFVGPLVAPPPAALAPHFAVGPQVFNFVELPRTQVFRNPDWGDYNAVQSGFAPCAITVGNSTLTSAEEGQPQYVGMPENAGDWGAYLAIDWSTPVPLAGFPTSGFVGLVATTTLPPLASGGGARLVYTQLMFWSGNSTNSTPAVPVVRAEYGTGIVGVVTFAYDQLPTSNLSRSYAIDLSPFLDKTFRALGVSGVGGVLSYTYLLVAGYNYHLRVGIRHLLVEGPSSVCPGASSSLTLPFLLAGLPLSAWLVATVATAQKD